MGRWRGGGVNGWMPKAVHASVPGEQVTYKRLKEAVQSLANPSQQGPASGLVDVLFGQRPPRFMANLPPWTPINSGTHNRSSCVPEVGLDD